ncbi:hypothetical protein SeseC_00435 [Streptococcus equi subsp. zooepidemicus ATCC 35246]|nr:hypothetical protein SeseC_00435 [Streptococcus equi subsp. zooepidemicus ATCC 35246]
MTGLKAVFQMISPVKVLRPQANSIDRADQGRSCFSAG